MGHLIPEDVVESVRQANPIEDVVSSYFPLKPVGRNLVARCPFHAEKSPSFNVNPERQIFKCFGCDKAGDVFTFVRELERLDYPSAIRFLARRANISIDEGPGTEAGEREEIRKALEWATRLYETALRQEPAGEPGRAYLRGRAMERPSWDRFRLGFAPDGADFLRSSARRQGLSDALLRKAGLVSERRSGDLIDFFRGRVMFPIQDPQGRTIAFGGRTLDEERHPPKYLNSAESPLFHKGSTLYGLHQGRLEISREREAIVMEGYTDVIMAHQCGVPCAVAALGTALTREHLVILERFADRVFLLFDGDEAGEKATFRSLDLFLDSSLEVRVLALSGGVDPFDFLKARGGKALEDLLDDASEIFEFLWRRLQARMADASPPAQLHALGEILERVARLPDELKREVWLRHIAERTGFSADALRARAKAPAPTRTPAPPSPAPAAPPENATERAQVWLSALLAMRPDFRTAFREDPDLAAALDPDWRAAAERILHAPALPGGDILAAAVAGIENDALKARIIESALQIEPGESMDRLYEDCAGFLRDRSARRRREALQAARSTPLDAASLERNLRATYATYREGSPLPEAWTEKKS